MEEAEKSWREILGVERIKPLRDDVPSKAGIPVQDNPLKQQELAAR